MSSQHPYTTEHIKLYLEGKLSAAEMHAMEKAAMDDPFLADAIEGMQIVQETQGLEHFNEHAKEMQQRLAERIKRKRTLKTIAVESIWWKAAAVLVLMVTGLVVVLLMNEKNDVQPATVAKNETFKRKEAVVADTIQRDTAGKNAIAELPSKRKAFKKEVTLYDSLPQPQSRKMKAQTEQKDLTFEAPSSRQDSTAAAAPAPERALQGKAAGVVVGYGTSKRSSKERSLNNAEPEGGWEAFDRYILEHRNIQSPDSALHGDVALTFTIDKKGRPSAINVATSLSPAHDEQAVKLLKEGPSWKVTRGRSRKATITVNF